MSKKFDPVEDFSMIEAGSLLVAKVIGYLWTAALFLKVKVFRKEVGSSFYLQYLTLCHFK